MGARKSIKPVVSGVTAHDKGTTNKTTSNKHVTPRVSLGKAKTSMKWTTSRFRRVRNEAAQPDRPSAVDVPTVHDHTKPPPDEYVAACLQNATNSFFEPCDRDDECRNQYSKLVAIEAGIKVRDFAFVPEPVLGLRPLSSGALLDERIPTVFEPTRPYLEFQYMCKVYFQLGKFDMPAAHVTPEDIDRLYTIGWISLNDISSFALGRELLGNGLWRRRQRVAGVPAKNGVVAQMRPWTIPKSIVKPGEQTLEAYFNTVEDQRRKEKDEHITKIYPIPIENRPIFSIEQDGRHLAENGILALRKKGISDELSEEWLKQRDVSFIPYGSSLVHPAPGKKYGDYESPSAPLMNTVPFIVMQYEVPAKFAHPEPLFLIERVEIEREQTPTGTPTPRSSTETEFVVSSASGSKKRRRFGPIDREEPGRRTRARIVTEKEVSEGPAHHTRSRSAHP